MNFLKSIVPLGLAVLLAVGCQSPVSNPTGPSSETAKYGKLTLKVSAISAELKKAQAMAGSRALLYADKVAVTIKSGATSIYSSTVSLSSTESTSTVQSFNLVPVGVDLTVAVSVYNAANNAWTVGGQTTGVSILEGQTTSATVVCLPTYPYSLSKNTLASVTLAAKREIWYTFGSYSTPSFVISQGSTDGVSTLLYDGQGELVATILGGTSYTLTPTPNSTYYVGVAAGSSTSVSQLTLGATVFNEGSNARVELTAGNDHTFLIGSSSGETTSYYRFTTTTAGTYLLQADGSPASVYCLLYSSGNFLQYGYLFPDLAASTTYEVELYNGGSSNKSFVGRLLDPAGYAAISAAEGTSAVPVEVTVGTPRASTVGGHFYDLVSYYTFVTGSDVTVAFQIEDGGDSDYLQAELSPSPTFEYDTVDTLYLYPGVAAERTLTPNTRYYLRLSNPSTSDRSFSLSVSQPTYLPSVLGNTWVDGTLTSAEQQQHFQFAVEPGTLIEFFLEDRYVNSSDFTGDVLANLRTEAGAALIGYLDDSAQGVIVTVPAGCHNVLLTVSPYSGAVTTDQTYRWKLVQVAAGSLSLTVR